MKTHRIYAAYGSNLNHEQMSKRCPKAKFIGTGVLQNYRLVFRGVADIEYSHGSKVMIGLWNVSNDCVDALDRYEGYPSLYGRNNVQIYRGAGKHTDAFIYFMNSMDYRPPQAHYLKSIADGYEDCNLSLTPLKDALEFTFVQYESANNPALA